MEKHIKPFIKTIMSCIKSFIKIIKNYMNIIILIIIALFLIFLSIKFIPNNYDLAYAIIGGISGGIFTIIGVNQTIKYQNKIEQENRRLNVLPIFECDVKSITDTENYLNDHVTCGFSIENATPKDFTTPDTENIFQLEINNFGIGNAQNVGAKFLITTKDIQTEENCFEELFLIPLGRFIKANETTIFNFYIPFIDFTKDYSMFYINISLYFQDLLNNQYSQKFSFVVDDRDLRENENNKFHVGSIVLYENQNLEKRKNVIKSNWFQN
jgi:hypothetical protein